jgi:hypothetical protein
MFLKQKKPRPQPGLFYLQSGKTNHQRYQILNHHKIAAVKGNLAAYILSAINEIRSFAVKV